MKQASEILFAFIEPQNISVIMPLMRIINTDTPSDILEQRVTEMAGQNYKCLGIYHADQLIGICGLWFMTRHYCGRSIEPDHVIIHPDYQGQGIGHLLFEWIFNYANSNGYDATELNTYVQNTASHKFYYNLGYVIKGYHFVKFLK